MQENWTHNAVVQYTKNKPAAAIIILLSLQSEVSHTADKQQRNNEARCCLLELSLPSVFFSFFLQPELLFIYQLTIISVTLKVSKLQKMPI